MCSTTRWQHPARWIFQQHYSEDEGWEMAHLIQLCGLVSYGRACRRRRPSMDPWAGATSQRRTLSSCKLINDQHQCITEILGRETKTTSTWTQGNQVGERREKFCRVQPGENFIRMQPRNWWINNLAAAPLGPKDGWLSMRGQYRRGE
jgi:hypothetical protein